MADFFAKGKKPINGYGGGNLASKSDLTSIFETGTTASQAISAGTYFYLDGTLARAKTGIASGATFTLNINYVVVSQGALNSIIKSMELTRTTSGSGNMVLTNFPLNGNKRIISAVPSRDTAVLMVSQLSGNYTIHARDITNWSAIASTSITFTVYYIEE